MSVSTFAERIRSFRLLPPNRELGWTPFAWLLYLPTLFVAPASQHASPLAWTVTIVVVCLFLPSYFRGFWSRKRRRLLPIVAFQVALGIVLSTVNGGAVVLFVYAASFAAQVDNSKLAVRLIAAITVIGVVVAAIFDGPSYQWIVALIVTPVIGGVNLHYSEVGRANAKLRLAHDEIEHLAVVAERERIARDMHDVLGHTLSLIVLKAELASKLADIDPARATKEIRELEQVARHALQEVRQAIGGYRATLAEEVVRARTLLEAAGIAGDIDIPHVQLERNREEVLAFALREAVTNVVRHSGAKRVTIRLVGDGDSLSLDVADDGHGGDQTEGAGLRGMRVRVEAIGGTLFREHGGGTRLTVRL
ncbi:MAG: sensor histidine kinase [Gemmatimonadetes bacterium]|nr:sensor histidine kinase [Gemmatimonadota bacterium]